MPTPDLLDPTFYGDIDGMHDAFRAMRADGPVHRDEVNGLWAVVHHAPLVDVERRADVFSSSGCYRSPRGAAGRGHDRQGRSRAP